MAEAAMLDSQDVSDGGASIHAPLLASVFERLREGRRWVILDLGPALPGNLGLFHHFRCRLTVADATSELTSAVRSDDAEPDPRALAGHLARVIPDPGREPWDLVLFWDLVNYLPRPVLAALMAHIAGNLRQGSLVHCFVESSRPQMPPEPGVFAIQPEFRLRRIGAAEPTRPSPRYSHWDLVQA
ncbi:MAG: hypothetical protein PVH31_03340, partial [Ectothiorhodospiraceae bacterium]